MVALPHTRRVLLAESSEPMRKMLYEQFNRAGYNNVAEVETVEEARTIIQRWQPHLAVIEHALPETGGLKLCETLQREGIHERMVLLLLSDQEQPDPTYSAHRAGANDVLGRTPRDAAACVGRARIHLEHLALRQENVRNYQRLQQELGEAMRLQQLLLPSTMLMGDIRARHGVDFAVHYQPCSELGGDYVTLEPCPHHPSTFWFTCVDVSGHGLAACLLAFASRALFKLQPHDTPADVLTRVNAELHPLLPVGSFATACCARLDLSTKALTYAGAGHPLPLLLRRGEVQWLDTAGLPLGLHPAATYQTQHHRIAPGDVLIFYSDGLTDTLAHREAKTGNAEKEAQEKLADWLRHQPISSASGILEQCLTWLQTHESGEIFCDDLTLLACCL